MMQNQSKSSRNNSYLQTQADRPDPSVRDILRIFKDTVFYESLDELFRKVRYALCLQRACLYLKRMDRMAEELSATGEKYSERRAFTSQEGSK